jgi:3-isopropylmalate/(R)-2-methylmalate dehydratase large subunit
MTKSVSSTITEKILARTAHRDTVHPGEVVYVEPDFATSSDFRTYPYLARTLKEIGVTQVAHPDKIAITVDHCFPPPDTKWANNHRGLKEWVERQGIKYFYYGEGINAQILAEKGHALPGTFIAVNDFNTNLGALGCFVSSFGTSILEVYATWRMWIIVPKTIRVELEG